VASTFYFPLGTAVGEDCSNCLLTRGEVGSDVEQLDGVRGSFSSKLVHQLLASGTGDECPNDVRVRDVGELSVLLRKTFDEVSERLVELLTTDPGVLGVSRAHVCALKILDKDLDQVGPAMD
jgi:hypothetical protein